MDIQKRLTIAGILVIIASSLYGAGRYYSPVLIQYVVEQSLIQKAPAGTDSRYLRERVRALVSAIPDEKAKTRRLLRISEYVEKVQSLTPEDLHKLLDPEKE